MKCCPAPLLTVLMTALLCMAAAANADQNDPRLDDLFQKLKAADNLTQTAQVETAIWQIWIEHDNAEYADLMRTGIRQMNMNALPAALATFDRLVELAPGFAEAWNKRATIHWLLQDYAASEADITRTLALEPFHFGALSGLGLVYMGQQKFEQARNALHNALEVNPNMPAVKQNLDAINGYLRGNSI